MKKSKENAFKLTLLKKTIRLTVSSSPLRNQVYRKNKNDLKEKILIHIRDYLFEEIKISDLQRLKNENQYKNWLKEKTNNLVNEFKNKNGLQWGSARKVLNLIMEDIYFNYYLRDSIKSIWNYLEIPVDSKVHAYTYEKMGEKVVKFKIKGLEEGSVYDNYQEVANKQVKKEGVSRRIELDPCIWLGERIN